MDQLTLGVIGTSEKTDEQRVPIHPHHLGRIPESLRRQLIFEEGYGARFDMTDAELAGLSGGVTSRHKFLRISVRPSYSSLSPLTSRNCAKAASCGATFIAYSNAP